MENGYTVPSVATLEKYARALEVPLHTLFHDGAGPIEKPNLEAPTSSEVLWGARGKERNELRLFAKALSKMNEPKRKLLFAIAQQMANR
jgi:transcriptional regulator with XRE-family HTH domain